MLFPNRQTLLPISSYINQGCYWLLKYVLISLSTLFDDAIVVFCIWLYQLFQTNLFTHCTSSICGKNDNSVKGVFTNCFVSWPTACSIFSVEFLNLVKLTRLGFYAHPAGKYLPKFMSVNFKVTIWNINW